MNGLKIQWGLNNQSSSVIKTNFYVEFTQTPMVVYSTERESGGATVYYGVIYNLNKSSFEVDTNHGYSEKLKYRWIAIGY